jgi:ABC-type Fe3+ transport system permease subunit
MFEHRRQRPISRRRFVGRLLHSAAYAGGLVGGSLVIGTAGYHWLGGQGWIDSLLNAAMLLGGMGPVGDLPSTAGKLFAAGFALYAGMVFLIVAGLLLTPLFHRVLHLFHWEADAKGD